MNVLGISASPRTDHTTDKLVQEVLAGCEVETEFLSLAGKHIAPCIACLGCIRDNVCIVNDDMAPMRQKLLDADALVLGAPNYFNTLNAILHCFLERFYQFRHRDGKALAGKLAVAVGVGGGDPKPVVEAIKTFLHYNQIECVGEVTAQGVASCFTCGYGEDCKTGAIHMFFGPGTKITPDITPSLDKQPQAAQHAREVGQALSDRLKQFASGT